MFISIGLLLIIIILEEIISYFMLRKNKIGYQRIIGITGIIIGYFIFGILTYNPIQTELFIDPKTNTYGIEK